MAFSALTDAEVAVLKAVTTTLMRKIKDNFDYLYGQSNSLLQVQNADFEVDSDADGQPDNWTINTNPGGTVQLTSEGANTPLQGAQSLEFIHPGGAGNGGGTAESDFLPVYGGQVLEIKFLLKVSATGAKNIVTCKYYDEDQVTISSDSVIYSSTSGPTSATMIYCTDTVPATARYMTIELEGGATDTDPGAERTTTFDNIRVVPLLQTDDLADGIITQAKLDSAAVGQAQLKTTTQTITDTRSSMTLLNGGQYGFSCTFAVDYYGGNSITAPVYWLNGAYKNTGTIASLTSGSYASADAAAYQTGMYVDIVHRYVQASPPYNLGEGDIPMFIFALVNKTTWEIDTLSVSPEAPWHNNGPTNIRPDVVTQDGRKFKYVTKNFNPLNFDKEEKKQELVEITQSIKNADMDLIPHNWLANDLSNHVVVLVDPVSDMVWKIFEAFENERKAFHKIIKDKHMTLNTSQLNRIGPKGVQVHALEWK